MTQRILRNATSAELYYSIASIKHQIARGSMQKSSQQAQLRYCLCRFAPTNSHSKTACRGFKSFCPCHKRATK